MGQWAAALCKWVESLNLLRDDGRVYVSVDGRARDIYTLTDDEWAELLDSDENPLKIRRPR